MPSTEITDASERSRYEVRLDGELAGHLAYEDTDGVRVLTHTVIRDGFEGRGVGSKLVRWVLDDLRASGRTMVPQCAFVRGYVERHDEYADLVA